MVGDRNVHPELPYLLPGKSLGYVQKSVAEVSIFMQQLQTSPNCHYHAILAPSQAYEVILWIFYFKHDRSKVQRHHRRGEQLGGRQFLPGRGLRMGMGVLCPSGERSSIVPISDSFHDAHQTIWTAHQRNGLRGSSDEPFWVQPSHLSSVCPSHHTGERK